MRKYILLLTVVILLPALGIAQPIKKAEKLMGKYNYSKAITVLKKAAKKNKTHNDAIPLLAECYRMQRDLVNSKATYALAVELPNAKPEYTFYCAQALQSVGDYENAKNMYLKYGQLNPSDKRGNLFAAHCDSVLGPWKHSVPGFEIKNAKSINTAESDFGPSFYSGKLVFASDHVKKLSESNEYGWTGRGFLDLQESKPVTIDDFWGDMEAPVQFDRKFNQIYHDGPATFSTDGNTMYFTRTYRDRAKLKANFRTNLLKIFYCTKTNGEWGEVMPFFLNNTDYSVGQPALSPDGKKLYFVSDMPGGFGGTDIYVCLLEGDKWGKAENLGNVINTTQDEMFPYITEDGILYFSSEGHPGYGALDIFETTQKNGDWATPVNLKAPLNSSFDDFALAFAPGKKNGFFSSNRTGGIGSDDIYAFVKLPPPVVEPPKPVFIAGVVKDKTTMQPIADATVFILDQASGKVKVLKTDNDGLFKLLVEKPGNFTVKAMKLNYIADCTPFNLSEFKPGTTTMAPRDLLLDKLIINKTFRVDNIFYDFDKYNIREDAKPELDKLVRIMKENPIKVELGSHTDSRGSFTYNDNLSQKRAESAVNYIIETGINKSRITAKGYGERQLTNKCADGVFCTPEEHQANRRTEFKVTSFDALVPQSDQFNTDRFNNGDLLELPTLPAGFFSPCK